MRNRAIRPPTSTATSTASARRMASIGTRRSSAPLGATLVTGLLLAAALPTSGGAASPAQPAGPEAAATRHRVPTAGLQGQEGAEAQEALQPGRVVEEIPYRAFAPGLLVRNTYRAPAEGALQVEIWDLLVGPGSRSEAARLPGAAVLEVRTGSGTALVDGESSELSLGATLLIGEEAEVAFDNPGEGPLSMRAILISAADR